MTATPIVDFSRVPKDLIEVDQWVVWRHMTRDGKGTKIPYSVTGKPASSTDPTTWCSFDRAVDALQNGNFAGIGYVFSSTDHFCGIDLDGCLDGGQIKRWAQPILERFADTYTEISPSGNGVKIWCRGRVPADTGKKWPFEDGAIEMYDHGRFFTVTAAVADGAPSEVEEHQAAINWVYETVTGADAPPRKRASLFTTEKVPGGQRHNFLMSMAAQFRTKGMGPSEILAALKAINAERCDPPKTDEELEKMANWVGQKEPGHKHRISPPQSIVTAAVPQPQANWREYLIAANNGVVKPILANACTALRMAPEWAGLLSYNEFGLSVVPTRKTPWGDQPAEWTDHEDRCLCEWLQREGISVTPATAGESVQRVAREQPFHPVRTFLASLRWDGEPRLDRWLSTYLGVENSEYSRAVGARWLIQAVARIYQPGCKADSCLILEGEQGIKKSTALKTMGYLWFTDEITDLGSKDAAMQTRGTWIIEISELDSMNRSDVGRIKAFISRATDRFRPPYGKHLINSPRQCVFAGSTNQSKYLRDDTGARRFWPVACTTIDIDSLERDREQIWGEAVARYQDGSIWWLAEQHIIEAAEAEQRARYEEDPWDDSIAVWLEDPQQARDEHGHSSFDPDFVSTKQSVTITDILKHCIGKDQQFWTQTDKNRVGRSLRTAGWELRKVRIGEKTTWSWVNNTNM